MKTLLLWLFMVAVVSLMPISDSAPDIPYADTVFHAILYAITAALIFNVMVTEAGSGMKAVLARMGGPATVWLAAALASSYGLLMEGAQDTFTPARQFSLGDAAANVMGASAWAVYVLWKSRKNKRTKKAQGG